MIAVYSIPSLACGRHRQLPWHDVKQHFSVMAMLFCFRGILSCHFPDNFMAVARSFCLG
jgi:hypothetical protein